MSKRHKYRMALNPATGNLEWAPAQPGTFSSFFGWTILAISTLVFLLIAAYFAWVFLLSKPHFDAGALPGGGSPEMTREVKQLRNDSASR